MPLVLEARVMNVRTFRAQFTKAGEPVIVFSEGVILGSWTPGTSNIDPAALAQILGLRDQLKAKPEPPIPLPPAVTKPRSSSFTPAPKPGKKR